MEKEHVCPSDDNGSGLVGCGQRFQQQPDNEGWVDCPHCGLAFKAEGPAERTKKD